MWAARGFKVDLDKLGCVLGLGQRLGDDEGDRLADEVHPSVGERWLRCDVSGRSVPLPATGRRALCAKSAVPELGGCKDREHAGGGAGCRGVDAADRRVGVRRAQDEAPHLPGRAHIVGV
jgi:hypothetical protein